ncbi:hypothetical protein Vretifemale_1889 [Volvox reticuliferus]|nr:hypothetical protein Vretifemale_1889 [Volvox reticuliferus]
MAMVAQSAGYPRNLSYLVKRLSGYSRNTFRLQTLNQTTATAGQIITVDLPSNALVDLSTLTMFFKGATSTTAGFAVFPRNIECLIERLEVEINGQIVNTGCAYYNQLWQILADTTFGTQVLPKSLAGAGENYTLSEIFFSVDTLSIDDGMFYQMHQNFLAQGGVYEIPFNNYFSFTSTGGLSQTTKFSLSTQSLNRVWATFIAGGNYQLGGAAGSAFFDANAGTASYFTRIGNAGTLTYGTNTNNQPVTYALTNYQFNINNVYYPNYKPTAEQAYALLLNAYNLSQDTLGGGYKNMDTLAKWNAAFWVACQEFDHGTDDYISGIDTRGNVAQCFFETQGTVSTGTAVGTAPTNPGTNLVALVFAQTTSTLRVGAGRMIELVM